MSTIPVFYSDEMVTESGCRSPGPSKPKLAVETWLRAGLPVKVHSIVQATYEDLCLAHDPGYVLGILSRQIDNGFRNTRADVTRSLPFSNGAMICAATYALATGGSACAPVCGFHHAGYNTASMFCTFNGLMISAIKLLRLKRVQRVLIVDTDFHYGNGTDDIIKHLRLRSEIENASLGKWFCTDVQAGRYLGYLTKVVERFKDFDLVLFHSGVDTHVDDPLGGVLDTLQMRQRDRMVFEGAKSAGVPIAWCLAGGYQSIEKVVALHTVTMEECSRQYCVAQSPKRLEHGSKRHASVTVSGRNSPRLGELCCFGWQMRIRSTVRGGLGMGSSAPAMRRDCYSDF